METLSVSAEANPENEKTIAPEATSVLSTVPTEYQMKEVKNHSRNYLCLDLVERPETDIGNSRLGCNYIINMYHKHLFATLLRSRDTECKKQMFLRIPHKAPHCVRTKDKSKFRWYALITAN